MTTAVRLINATTWSPDGRTVYTFAAGEIITARDPRAANGFLATALASRWAEPVSREPEPERNEAHPSPARPPSPARKMAAKAAAPRTASKAPARKRPKRDQPATE